MADPRLGGEWQAPTTGRRGRGTRPWLAVVVVLAVGVLAFGAFALGGGLHGAAEASASPSARIAASLPGEVTASAPAETAPAETAPAETTPGPSPSAVASGPLLPGLIAIVDASGALFTLDSNGGSRASYPAPGVAFGFPAWSPDGSHIAAVGQHETDSAIYVFKVRRSAGAATAPTVVYRSSDQPPFYVYWTPDSRQVSFLTQEPTELALRVAPVNGSTLLGGSDTASIVRRGAPLYFQWVNANRALLHVGGGADAFVGQVGPGGRAVGAPVDAKGLFRTANFSHDARYLAYATSDTATTGDVVVTASNGSTTRRLPAFGPAAMLFDPTGDSLATVVGDNPAAEALKLPVGPLRLVDPATGIVRTLVEGSVVGFFWAPDGKTIAALHVLGPGQGPAADVGDAPLAVARLPDPRTGATSDAPGSAVGLSFVDVSTGKVRSERVVQLGDPFISQLLPYFDQYALSHSLWSPDSTSIVLPLFDSSGAFHPAIIPADGSTDPRPFADGSRAFWSP